MCELFHVKISLDWVLLTVIDLYHFVVFAKTKTRKKTNISPIEIDLNLSYINYVTFVQRKISTIKTEQLIERLISLSE